MGDKRSNAGRFRLQAQRGRAEYQDCALHHGRQVFAPRHAMAIGEVRPDTPGGLAMLVCPSTSCTTLVWTSFQPEPIPAAWAAAAKARVCRGRLGWWRRAWETASAGSCGSPADIGAPL